MSFEAFSLYGEVKTETRQAEAGLARVDAKLRDTKGRFVATGGAATEFGSRTAAASGGVNSLATRLEGLKTRLSSLGSSLATFGASMSAAVTLPLAGLVAASVKSATGMDSLKRGLTAVAGSSAEAEKQLVRLREVAKLPGLGLREAIQGSIQLQAVKLSSNLAERSLMAFGNALATVGKGKAELDGVTLALTQIVSKGKVSAEEINQIAERVPQIREAMKQAFGTADTEQLQKMKIGPEKFIESVVKELEKLPRVAGGAQNTFENFSDTVDQAMTRIGERILPTLMPVVDFLGNAIPQVLNVVIGAFDSLSPSTQAGALAFAAVVAVAAPVAAAIGAIVVAISAVGAPFAAAAAVITVAVAAIAAAYTSNFLGIRDITNSALGEVVGFVQTQMGRVRAWFADNMPLIRQTVATVLAGVRALWEANGAHVMTVVRSAWSAIKAFITTASDLVYGVVRLAMQVINKDWAGAWETFKGLVRTAISGTVTILQSLGSLAIAALKIAINGILTLTSWAKEMMLSLGLAIVQGVVNGIKNGAASVANAARDMATAAYQAAKEKLGIHSPSLVFYAIGANVVAGFVNAVKDGRGAAAAAIAELVEPPEVKRSQFAKGKAGTQAYQTAREKAKAEKETNGPARDIYDRLIGQLAEVKARLAGVNTETEAGRLTVELQGKEYAKIGERMQALLTLKAREVDKENALLTARQRVAEMLKAQSERLQQILEVETPLTRVNALLSDPAIAAATDERTKKLLYLNASVEMIAASARAASEALEGVTLPPPPGDGNVPDLPQAPEFKPPPNAPKPQETIEQRIQRTREQVRNFADEVGGIFGNAVANWDGLFKGFFKSVGRGSADMLRDMAARLAASAVSKLIEKLLGGALGVNSNQSGGGSSGGGGGIGSIIGSAISSLFGGFRAAGGPVTAGVPYVVGERRPELFVPRQSGTILPFVPKGSSGGGSNDARPIQVTQHVHTNDAGSFRRSKMQIAAEMRAGLRHGERVA